MLVLLSKVKCTMIVCYFTDRIGHRLCTRMYTWFCNPPVHYLYFCIRSNFWPVILVNMLLFSLDGNAKAKKIFVQNHLLGRFIKC